MEGNLLFRYPNSVRYKEVRRAYVTAWGTLGGCQFGAMSKTRTTILMVDSDVAQRERNARVLRTGGFRVLGAGGYGEAVNIFQRHPGQISLLITAMTLPEQNGYELARRLCAAEPNIKVLFISGTTGAVISEFQEKRVEGAQTLFRPFDATVLLDRITRLLNDGLESAAEA